MCRGTLSECLAATVAARPPSVASAVPSAPRRSGPGATGGLVDQTSGIGIDREGRGVDGERRDVGEIGGGRARGARAVAEGGAPRPVRRPRGTGTAATAAPPAAGPP